MAHILNKPVLNNKKNLVIDGHGLMQPRVGINLEAFKAVGDILQHRYLL